MKTITLIIALMAFSTFSFAQEMKTLSSNDGIKNTTFGGYGGPLIQASYINDDWGIMMGGKGGVVINRRFALGGIGMGLINSTEFSGDDLKGDNNASLNLEYGVGGIFAEYIFKLESPIHFSIPVNFMAGGIAVNDATSDAEIESATIFVIEPGINVEFNVSKTFIPAINLSYRQVFGSSLDNLSNQDISGVNLGLVFKFGSF